MVGVERFELPTSCSQSLQQGKTGILGNCVFATFSKNIKQLTYAGCQSEIPLNSSRFRMNRKFYYQSATKLPTLFKYLYPIIFSSVTFVLNGKLGNYIPLSSLSIRSSQSVCTKKYLKQCLSQDWPMAKVLF